MSYTTEITDWKTAGAATYSRSVIWFVVKEDDKVLARAGLLKTIKADEIYFYQIFVDPEHRGKGLWNLLIETRLEYARQQNVRTIFSLCDDRKFPITEIMVNKGFVEVGKKNHLTLVRMDLTSPAEPTTA